jgi:hypothetical protein
MTVSTYLREIIGRTLEQMIIDGRKGGYIQGPKNAKSGGSLERGRHTRWHVRRKIININCPFCKQVA